MKSERIEIGDTVTMVLSDRSIHGVLLELPGTDAAIRQESCWVIRSDGHFNPLGPFAIQPPKNEIIYVKTFICVKLHSKKGE